MLSRSSAPSAIRGVIDAFSRLAPPWAWAGRKRGQRTRQPLEARGPPEARPPMAKRSRHRQGFHRRGGRLRQGPRWRSRHTTGKASTSVSVPTNRVNDFTDSQSNRKHTKFMQVSLATQPTLREAPPMFLTLKYASLQFEIPTPCTNLEPIWNTPASALNLPISTILALLPVD